MISLSYLRLLGAVGIAPGIMGPLPPGPITGTGGATGTETGMGLGGATGTETGMGLGGATGTGGGGASVVTFENGTLRVV